MKPLLCTVFINPNAALDLNLQQWDMLIRQARAANVLARLGFLLQDAGLWGKIPVKPLLHLESALVYFGRFYSSLQREIGYVHDALSVANVPLVLLKGSAYIMAVNAAAKGRTFSDVDILVPEDKLLEVEWALINAGWITSTLDPYDQKYYRQWMHEIPPLRHLDRQTSIDVHHNILPKTTEFCPDAALLLANCVKIDGQDSWVLATEDRVLHSATHLFHEGEFGQGFRDLSDLDLLLREFSGEGDFWEKLLQRAEALKQQVPLFYALRYTRKILQTPVPERILDAAGRQAGKKINTPLMDALFLRALMPDHASCNDRWTGLARWLLYVRSHWLRMPVHLMVSHLLRKSLRRVLGKEPH
ncbi:MAG: nucleotidyltransferase family protein [Methylococcales bacterium]|nr:nucleotidyltransferase family protein [Methylococcales bacterium]